jgi:hypothetical protein
MSTRRRTPAILRDWKITLAAAAVWLTVWTPVIIWWHSK